MVRLDGVHDVSKLSGNARRDWGHVWGALSAKFDTNNSEKKDHRGMQSKGEMAKYHLRWDFHLNPYPPESKQIFFKQPLNVCRNKICHNSM